MISFTDRNRSLAAAVIDEVPAYAASRDDLTSLFAASSDASAPVFNARLSEARRAATAEAWSSGAAGWRRRAPGVLALMNRAARDARTTRALMEVFAADFTDSTLRNGLDASNLIFPGHLLLDGATLEGALRLDETQVAGAFRARHAKIRHELSGDAASFVGPVALDGLEVTRSARFTASRFMSDLSLDGTIFHKDLWFRQSDFAGHVRMCRADLRYDVGLGACRYARGAQFDGTRFRDTCSFEDATFQDRLGLDACLFERRLRLDNVKLLGGASWHGARFLGEVTPSLAMLGAEPGPQQLMDRLRRAFGTG